MTLGRLDGATMGISQDIADGRALGEKLSIEDGRGTADGTAFGLTLGRRDGAAFEALPGIALDGARLGNIEADRYGVTNVNG